jgi:hypothetical protein
MRNVLAAQFAKAGDIALPEYSLAADIRDRPQPQVSERKDRVDRTPDGLDAPHQMSVRTED